jgi:hypothetical protein
MRLRACAMLMLTSSLLATRAAGDDATRTLHAEPTTGSSLAPIPAENSQERQASSLNQVAITRAYTRKYGTALNDMLTGIASDTLGNVYIAGNSTANSNPSGFLRKYSSGGTLLWNKAKAMVSIDGVALDKHDNVYISGSFATGSSLSTRHSIYLEKYDGEGTPLWQKSFKAGAAADPTFMIVNGIATDPSGKGFVLILFERAFWPYQTRQVFIRKYNSSGSPVWEKPAGNSSPYTSRPVLAVDKTGKICTAINTALNQRWNTTITQFGSHGDPVWSTSFHANPSAHETHVHGVTADPDGNFLVAGITKVNLEGGNLGFYDAFLRKYDNTGAVLWTRQFGTAANDYANSVATDAAGNVFVAGSSSGALASKNRGSFDAVMRIYGGNGELLHSRQFGTAESDIANGITLDPFGNPYVAGQTNGNIGGQNKGGLDVFFRKFTFSP